SSLESSHEFSVSRVGANGNAGVVSSVIWLTISAGLCFPWLLEQPSATKAGNAPKSVAWFFVLALDLLIGAMSAFSLWFRRSTLSIMLLIWGSCGILATFLVGSFAMLPAVATICCCAEDLCVMGAADTSPLNDGYCLTPLEMCMETKWSLWCYFGGILLAMISIVLVTNSAALHHKTLLDVEHQQAAAAKAVRAANRSRRRRQQLWEQEVYGGGSYGSNTELRMMSRSQRDSVHDHHSSSTLTHIADGSTSRRSDVAPSFETPTRAISRRPSRPIIPAAEIPAPSRSRVTPPLAFAPLEPIDDSTDIEMSKLGSPTSAPVSQNGFDNELREEFFAIGAYTGRGGGGGGGGG
ncbi:unnamed protein product, partial [Pylaiella littoralis]